MFPSPPPPTTTTTTATITTIATATVIFLIFVSGTHPLLFRIHGCIAGFALSRQHGLTPTCNGWLLKRHSAIEMFDKIVWANRGPCIASMCISKDWGFGSKNLSSPAARPSDVTACYVHIFWHVSLGPFQQKFVSATTGHQPFFLFGCCRPFSKIMGHRLDSVPLSLFGLLSPLPRKQNNATAPLQTLQYG